MKKITKKTNHNDLKVEKGSKLTSFLLIAFSLMIAAGVILGANTYYNIDTSEIVMEQIQRVTQVIRATTGLIVGGTATQNPASGYKLEVAGDTLFSGAAMIGNVSNNAQELRFLEGGATATQYVGLKAPTNLSTNRTYLLPHHDAYTPSDNMVLTWKTGNELRWQSLSGVGAGGDITAVGSMDTGDVFSGPSAHNQWLGLGSGAGRIAFVDGSPDYINILDANVGIGTATPNQKLSIAGTLGILETGTNPTYYTIFQGGDQSANITYTLPINTGELNYVLTTDGSGVLSWQSLTGVGAGGDITDVGNCPTGACFTSNGTSGTSLWFYDPDGRGQLTIADLSAPRTYTLPNATGTIALGTGMNNYVAYWTGENTLSSEQYLSNIRGGTGQNSSAWNGMIKVVGGTWSATTGIANYAAYWSDANTVAAEQYLSVTRGGTGAGAFTQYGIMYGNNTNAIGVTAAGTSNQILLANTGAAPSWGNISSLISATNGLTASGTTTLTLKLGGTLSEATTIAQGNYDMIFKLSGTGDFKITNASDNAIFTVTDDGKVLFKTYELAAAGKQILREMIPIFGFDLPSQCSTACDDEYAQISKTIEDYPFISTPTGATRKHKLVIRYATSDASTAIKFQVWDDTAGACVNQGSGCDIVIAASPSTDLEKGLAVTANVVLPATSTNDWYLRVQGAPGLTVRIYQIFLAAYDELN